mmetsp:Transcript_9175/g.26808  ORF Transcript_9175/g.26808 Transcript_9175/m.26808 type:complete len:223 (-) Transcript_9175:603-1271(-)
MHECAAAGDLEKPRARGPRPRRPRRGEAQGRRLRGRSQARRGAALVRRAPDVGAQGPAAREEIRKGARRVRGRFKEDGPQPPADAARRAPQGARRLRGLRRGHAVLRPVAGAAHPHPARAGRAGSIITGRAPVGGGGAPGRVGAAGTGRLRPRDGRCRPRAGARDRRAARGRRRERRGGRCRRRGGGRGPAGGGGSGARDGPVRARHLWSRREEGRRLGYRL